MKILIKDFNKDVRFLFLALEKFYILINTNMGYLHGLG